MPYDVSFGPPFDDLQTTGGAPAADAGALEDGRINARGWSWGAGSNQRWAFAGGGFWLPDDSPSITVSTSVTLQWDATAVAYFGYASSEVLVHLWTWGSDFGVQADRRSIAHLVMPFIGAWSDRGPTTVGLRRTFTRPRAAGQWLRAGVWVECWSGCGSPFAGSSASIATTVGAIRVRGS